MFKIALADQEDCTITAEVVITGRGKWVLASSVPGNYTYTFEGFDGEDIITLFIAPLREDMWDAVMVMQRPDSPMVMCRLGCPGLSVLEERINVTLRAWENF